MQQHHRLTVRWPMFDACQHLSPGAVPSAKEWPALARMSPVPSDTDRLFARRQFRSALAAVLCLMRRAAATSLDVVMHVVRESYMTQRIPGGFWLFLVSNVVWTVWGWHTHAYALVALQACLAITNIRGHRRNADAQSHTS